MMFAQFAALQVLIGRIRRMRQLLGWRGAIQLAVAQKMGRARLKVLLPPLGLSVDLRLNDSDVSVLEKVWINREYSLPFDITPEFIVDAGANTGLSALYFAYLFPEAQIIALEPEPANFELLVANCAGCPRIYPVHAALWKNSASVRIDSPGGDSWAFRVTEASGCEVENAHENVAAVTIPQLLALHARDRIDLLKLDIEGAEREIFTPECREWLPKVGVIVIELHDRYLPGCSRAFYSEIVRFRFAQESRGENIFIQLTSPL